MEAIGTFAGGIAHDFNNISTPIMGYAELALNRLHPTDPLRPGQEQILRAAIRAKDLVGQILKFARPGRDKQLSPVSVHQIMREALRFLRASLPSSIEIFHRIESGLANADPTQIYQLLMNLCTNAAHAIGDKGILEVGLSRVEFTQTDLAAKAIIDLKPGLYSKLWTRASEWMRRQ